MKNKYGFDASLMLDYNFDDGLFTILYDLKKALSEYKVKEILRLIEEHYSGSTFKEDWYIQSKNEITLSEYILNYYIHRQGHINDVIINIPVYIQGITGELYIEFTKHLGLELILNESNEGAFYGITVYPYVYFDYTTINKKGEKLDQRKASKINREILRNFLIDLENIIGAKPEDVSSALPHFEDKIYEYGVLEGAEYLL